MSLSEKQVDELNNLFNLTEFEFKTKTFNDLYETEQGRKIWCFLNEPTSIARMQAVSDVGKPALLAIEARLISDFQVSENATIDKNNKEKKAQFDRLKQMLGAMVRQVMERNGYKLNSSNVKVPSSKVFYSASSYVINS